MAGLVTLGACGGSVGSGGDVGSGGETSAATGGASLGSGGETSSATGGDASLGSGGETSSATGGAGGDDSIGDPEGSVLLDVQDGWVQSDVVGIQGELYTFRDESGQSTIAPLTFVDSGDTICVNGVAAEVDLSCEHDDCYGYFWGAGVGLNLNQARGSDLLAGYDADAEGVIGIAFELTGSVIPQGLQFHAQGLGDDAAYCIPITGGERTVLFGDLKKNCWSPTAGQVDTRNLQAIQWWISTSASSPRPFDFCIENLRVIRQ